MSLTVKALVVSAALNLTPILGLLWGIGAFEAPPVYCTSFATQRQAQAFYEQYGAHAFDIPPDVIDHDGNGQVCENRPKGKAVVPGFDARHYLNTNDDSTALIVLLLAGGVFGTFIFHIPIAEWLDPANRAKERDRSSGQPGARPSYHSYLRSEAWADKRQAALERAGWRRQLCNRSGQFGSAPPNVSPARR
jgi:hypothetical protein